MESDPMTSQAAKVLEAALALPESERAAFVDELYASLRRTDPRIDELWAKEAEDRLAAYEAGEMKAIPAEQVFKEMESL
jgi:putative addiction module component (TIGR02574 family)